MVLQQASASRCPTYKVAGFRLDLLLCVISPRSLRQHLLSMKVSSSSKMRPDALGGEEERQAGLGRAADDSGVPRGSCRAVPRLLEQLPSSCYFPGYLFYTIVAIAEDGGIRNIDGISPRDGEDVEPVGIKAYGTIPSRRRIPLLGRIPARGNHQHPAKPHAPGPVTLGVQSILLLVP